MRYLKSFAILLCVVLFAGAQVVAQNAVHDAAQRKIDEKKLQEYFQKNDLHPKKGAGGMYYTITKEGTGRQVLIGEVVKMNYTGRLLDGTVFDSNTDPAFRHQEPFEFQIGSGRVIRGWEKGIQQLKKGSVATLYIPSLMGYGEDGGPRIPANSILIFDVEVLDVMKGE
jgi:FKBP-type peptidyl-prolyl cis-trans isomerase FkpA